MLGMIAIGCATMPESAKGLPQLPAARVERNIVYGMYSGLALLMDVYFPENPNGYGLIHISGSGWKAPLDLDARPLNHSGHVETEGTALVAAGYTLFSVNHRATPRFLYPAAVEDVQRAVRFIRHNAAEYGIDPDRIGAVGGSSGGHLVSMLGLLDGDGDPDDESPINRLSAKVQCVVARATPASFLNSEKDSSFLGLSFEDIMDPKSDAHKVAVEASPLTYIFAGDPPFLLLHGDKDDRVPFKMSEMLLAGLEEVGTPVKLIRVEGAGHGPGFKGAIDLPDLGAEMVAWMDTYLREE